MSEDESYKDGQHAAKDHVERLSWSLDVLSAFARDVREAEKSTKERQARGIIWLYIMFMSIGLVFVFMGMMIMILEPPAYESIEMSKVEAFGAMVMFAGLLMFSLFGVSPKELIAALAAKKPGLKSGDK